MPFIDPHMSEMSGCNPNMVNTESVYFLRVCVFLFAGESKSVFKSEEIDREDFLSGPHNFTGVCEG